MIFTERAPVAVVIPVHDSRDRLEQSLVLLRGLSLPEATVVVVDDGSTDGTAEFLDQVADVVTIRGSGNLWWSGAVDVGSRLAIDRGAEVIALWNDDNLAASCDCLTKLVARVRETGGCASPVVLEEHADGSRVIMQAGGAVDWRRGVIRRHAHGNSYRPSELADTRPWLPGNVLVFGADLFQRLGGFDAAAFPQYRGDADFTLRATYAGAPCDVLYSCWALNDRSRTGMGFQSRVSPRLFVRGLVALGSNYHLPSTLRFYWRHCPRRYVVMSVALFYLKYIYASLKTWRLDRT
jgi:GT2 family glycosyltransferase